MSLTTQHREGAGLGMADGRLRGVVVGMNEDVRPSSSLPNKEIRRHAAAASPCDRFFRKLVDYPVRRMRASLQPPHLPHTITSSSPSVHTLPCPSTFACNNHGATDQPRQVGLPLSTSLL